MYWFESWLLHIWWQVSAYALRKQWGKVQVLGSVPMWKAQKLLTSTFKSVQLISGCYGCLVGEPEDGRFLSLSLFSMYICLKMKISKSLKEKKKQFTYFKSKVAETEHGKGLGDGRGGQGYASLKPGAQSLILLSHRDIGNPCTWAISAFQVPIAGRWVSHHLPVFPCLCHKLQLIMPQHQPLLWYQNSLDEVYNTKTECAVGRKTSELPLLTIFCETLVIVDFNCLSPIANLVSRCPSL